VALGPVASRAQILVHEVLRAEELTERQRAHSADHAGLEVEVHRAGHVLAALGLVVKRDDTAELRVVAALVLTVAAYAMFVAHHLLRLLDAHLATALTYLNVDKLARKSSLEAGSTREKKKAGGAEKRKELRAAVWHGKPETPVARSRDPERENAVVLPLKPLELWAPYKGR
jgi:hypothetical protein